MGNPDRRFRRNNYLLLKNKRKESVEMMTRKILEYPFERDDGSRSSFWSWY